MVNGCDLAQESESGAAVVAAERLWFGEDRWRFAEFAELKAQQEAGSAGGGTEEAVVANASEALGQDVKKPTSNELVGVQRHDRTAPGIT